ncbi:Transcription elongation factor spt6, partial [Linderina pennispora]
MSDIDDYDRAERHRSRRGVYDDDEEEEGSDTFDHRPAFDDDDEDEEDDEQDMEELRDGFVVDDDDVEDVVSDDEERRRRKKKKKKRRHAERDRSHDNDDDDLLDEEDLALVAENTNQGSYSTGASGSKFKRLKRGRSRKALDDEDDLDAELNDLVDNGGSDDGHSRHRDRGGYSDDERGYGYDDMKRSGGGRRDDYDDSLGLFENDDDNELAADDYRSNRRNDRRREDRQRLTRDGYEMDDGIDDDLAVDDRGRSGRLDSDADMGVPRTSGGERTGAMASYFGDNLDGIDDDTWAELQDIFGDGEEYAFAMESTQGESSRYREKGLDEVFEPAELEAKMMTQRDEEIRSTDVPERMQMRATGSDSLRTLTEEEIEEETTWVVRQLHVMFQRQESLRPRQQDTAGWGDSAGGFGAGPQAEHRTLFKHADFANERFLAAVLSVLKLLSQEFYEVPYIVRHRREIFVTPIAPGEDTGASGFNGDQSEELPTREWLSHDDIWKLYDFDQQFRGFLSCRHQLTNLLRRLRGETNRSDDVVDDALAPVESMISNDDEVYVQTLTTTATRVEDITDITEWLHSQYSEVIRSWKNQGTLKRSRVLGMWEQAKQSGIDKFLSRFGITARQVGTNIFNPGSHYIDDNDSAATPLTVAQQFVGSHFATAELVARVGKSMFAQSLAADPQIRRFVRSYCDEHTCMITRPTERGRREITHDDHPAFEFKFLKQKPLAEFMNSAQFIEIEKAEKDGLIRLQFSLTGEYRFDNHDMGSDDRVFDEDKERTAQVIALQIEKHVRSDAVHEAADEWNRLRSEAVTAAVTDHLLPMIWRETTQRLQQQAFDVIADASRRSLENRIDMQPAKNARMLSGEKPRVVVVGGGGFDASSRGSLRIVYVNEHGKYVEHFTADSMRQMSGSMATDGDG